MSTGGKGFSKEEIRARNAMKRKDTAAIARRQKRFEAAEAKKAAVEAVKAANKPKAPARRPPARRRTPKA